MSAIVISDMTKRLGKKRLFQNLNLEVLEGEFFALLGQEGSGKTAIAKILFNYLKPAKGSVRIYDLDPTKDAKLIKESVSYVPEEPSFDENIRASALFSKTLKLHNFASYDEVNKLTDLFKFNSRLRFPEMTVGEKKVCAIINALITKPRLVILDEPAKFLSDEDVEVLFAYLTDLKVTEGLGAFILTDNLINAQRFCDRAAYLHDGQIQNVEYLNDKVANDKIVRIRKNLKDVTAFTTIGAILLKDSPYEKIFYYDRDMNLLSRVIADHMIEDYTIENCSLDDKMAAYFGGDRAAYFINDYGDEYRKTMEAKRQADMAHAVDTESAYSDTAMTSDETKVVESVEINAASPIAPVAPTETIKLDTAQVASASVSSREAETIPPARSIDDFKRDGDAESVPNFATDPAESDAATKKHYTLSQTQPLAPKGTMGQDSRMTDNREVRR
ncbi:ABC transporter ATP-binding protein [Peptoniphilus equinus]|uniref:ABC transporter ATP-binding protein n=1 Tax=Peptoniphilus equinus TaxID=3016343 RepID=A0ABY7QV53_9FIRM|nr:ABC transporter ATP-binding protein [Peptoniphilus equinus]WBW50664.1 ABC transporter ATP-binding protein [Peptoniphilus equinus]